MEKDKKKYSITQWLQHSPVCGKLRYKYLSPKKYLFIQCRTAPAGKTETNPPQNPNRFVDRALNVAEAQSRS